MTFSRLSPRYQRLPDDRAESPATWMGARARTSAGITGTGTGIGLNLVKQLVEMHTGTIEVDSVEGQGSVFTVRLPIDLRAAGDPAQGTGGRTTPVLTEVKRALAT